ncbi:MAG: hypothetical protein RLY97_1641 [Pseudomonadota bacterium]|jgi:protein-L-isoaspartate(D-aspartate) O-methyltransferase
MTLTATRPATDPYAAARRAMIDSQLRTSGVNEPWVLAAFSALPREDFVPTAMRDAAYIDRAIALDNGRFLAAPLVHGKMLAEAMPNTADNALLIGDANGYLAALLRPLVGALDCLDPAKASKAKKASFSLILIDGAAEKLPDAVTKSLTEGGRLVTGLLERGITRLATGFMAGGHLALLPLAEMGIPSLPEFAAAKSWSF